MHKKNNAHFLFILFFNTTILCAQDNESQSWNNLEITYDIYENIELSAEGGMRSNLSPNELFKIFSDFSIKKKYNSIISYSAGFRYASNRKKNGFEAQNRFYVDFYLKQGLWSNFNIVYRNRFQTQHAFDYYVSKIRQKIKLNYDLKAWSLDTYVALELFYVLEGEFEKTRYVVGLKKSLLNRLDLGLSYMIQKEMDSDSSELLYAFRTKLSYQF